MIKDVIYSMRMNSRVRDALKKAAQRERRTVASLLDKIITDYLEKEGILIRNGFSEERRRFRRKKIILPSATHLQTGAAAGSFPSVILDLSGGGVLVTYPKGSEIKVSSLGELPNFSLSFELPNSGESVRFDCDARRMFDTGSEIQVGATFKQPDENNLHKLQTFLS